MRPVDTAALTTGLLPGGELEAVARRCGPVLASLVAVTVMAELADGAGAFDAAARLAARAGRGRTPLLRVLVVVLASASTVVLSLDTTVALLTPVVLSLATLLRLERCRARGVRVPLGRCAAQGLLGAAAAVGAAVLALAA